MKISKGLAWPDTSTMECGNTPHQEKERDTPESWSLVPVSAERDLSLSLNAAIILDRTSRILQNAIYSGEIDLYLGSWTNKNVADDEKINILLSQTCWLYWML